MSEAIRQLWAAQERQAAPPPEEELRKRARRLHRQLALRNGIEYAAGAAASAVFAWFAFVAPTIWISLGCLSIIAGIVVTLVNVHRRRGRRPGRDGHLALNCRAFLLGELVRQRDALSSVWRWYLLPMEAGMALFLGSVWIYAAEMRGAGPATERLLPVLAVVIGISAFIFWINRIAARDLQREIDSLEGGGGSEGD